MDASGAGNGDGGIINIVTNSSNGNPFTTSAGGYPFGSPPSNGIFALSASAGNDANLSAGSGGAISINNLGTDGITISNASSDLNVAVSNGAAGGNGGSISLITANGTLSFGISSPFNLSGQVNGHGGSVNLNAAQLNLPQALLFAVAGVGTGSGGSVAITVHSGGDLDGTVLSSADISSDGASAGSLSLRTGGAVNLINNGGVILSTFAGGNGNGAILDFEAGQFNGGSTGEVQVGALSAAGSGSGNGGTITLVSNSSNPFLFDGGTANSSSKLDVSSTGNGGVTSVGNAGSIIVRNQGGGGITFVSSQGGNATIVDTAGLSGNGAQVTFDAGTGNLVLSTNLLAASGGGILADGTAPSAGVVYGAPAQVVEGPRGGTINLLYSTLQAGLTNSPTTLSATGADGGAVNITSTDAGLSLGNVVGGIMINAGSTSGNAPFATAVGGSTNINVAGALQIAAGSLLLDAAATKNYTGANISLTAGNGLKVLMPLEANSFGRGNTGNISISYGDSTNPFVVATGNSSLPFSGVSPSSASNSLPTISASSLASVDGVSSAPGSVSIHNTQGPTNLSLVGNIVAQSQASGNFDSAINSTASNFVPNGQLTFGNGSAAVSVTGSGALGGQVSVNASGAVVVQLNTSGSKLQVGSINSQNKSIQLQADAIDLRSADVVGSSLAISPFSNLAVTLGSNNKSVNSSTFDVVNGEFYNVHLSSAGNFSVANGAAGVTMLGNLDLSQPAINLSVVTTGTFKFDSAFAFTLGNQNLSISANSINFNSNPSPIGGIVGNNLVSLTSATPVTLSGSIDLGSGSGALDVTAPGITVLPNVSVLGSTSCAMCTVALSSTGTGAIVIPSSSTVAAYAINLSSGTGNIGTPAGSVPASLVFVDAKVLALSTGGNGSVVVADTQNSAQVTVSGAAGSGGFNFSSITSTNIGLSGIVDSKGTVTLNISIGDLNSIGAIVAPTVNLFAASSSSAVAVKLNTFNSTVIVPNVVAELSIANSGSLTAQGAGFGNSSIGSVALQSTSGNINLSGNTGNSIGTTSIQAGGTIAIPVGSVLSGSKLLIGATGGFGTISNPITSDSAAVQLASGSSGIQVLNLTSIDPITLDQQSASNGVIQITALATHQLTVASISSTFIASSVKLTTVNGNILVGANGIVGGGGSTVNLITTGSGSIFSLGSGASAGVIQAQSLNIKVGVGGNIGTPQIGPTQAVPLVTAVNQLTVNTSGGSDSTTGNAIISNAAPNLSFLSILNSSVSAQLQVTESAGSIQTSGAVLSPNITLTSTNESVGINSVVGGATLILSAGNTITESSSGTILATQLSLSSGSGNMGTLAHPIALPANLATFSVQTGSTNNNAYFTSPSALTISSQGSDSPIYNISAASNVNIDGSGHQVNLGNVFVANAVTTNSPSPGIGVTNASVINLTSNSTLNATDTKNGSAGSIILISNSAINLQSGSRIFSNGNVILSANGGSSVTPPPSLTGTDASITFNPNSAPPIYDQVVGGVLATNTSSGSNQVTALGTTNVFLLTDGNTGNNVVFQGGVNVTATSTPHLSSLDLSNHAVAIAVQALPGNSGTSGLKVGSGGATGGTAIIDASQLSGAALTALNVPKGVSLQLQDFTSQDPLSISISATSSTKQVLINGSASFPNTTNVSAATSNAINVTSNQSLTSLVVGSAGSFSNLAGVTSPSLLISSNGDISTSGPVTGIAAVTISGANITLSAPVTAGGDLNVHAANNLVISSSPVAAAMSTIGLDAGNVFNLTAAVGSSTNAIVSLLAVNNFIQSSAAKILGTDVSISSLSGGIALAANVGSSSTMIINLQAATNVTQSAGILVTSQAGTGGSIFLAAQSVGSFGTVSANLKTETSEIGVSSEANSPLQAPSFFINNNNTAGVAIVGGGTRQFNTLQLTSNGTITNSGSVSTNNLSFLPSSSTANAGIQNNGSLVADNTVILTAGGNGSILGSNTSVISAGVTKLTTVAGSIGTSADPLILAGGQLSVNTGSGSGQSVFVSELQGPTILLASTAPNFNIIASSNLLLGGNVTVSSSSNFNVTGTLILGGFGIVAAAGSTPAQTITVNGAITESAGTSKGIVGNSVTLQASSNIGSSTIPLRISTNTLTLNGFNSDAYINNSNTGTLSLLAGTADTLSLVTSGSVAIKRSDDCQDFDVEHRCARKYYC